MFSGKYGYSRYSSQSFNYFSEVVKEEYSPMDMVDKNLLEQRIKSVLSKVEIELERLKSVEDLDKEFNISPERFHLVESPYTEDEIAESLNRWHELGGARKEIFSYDRISRILKMELRLEYPSGESILENMIIRVQELTKPLEVLLDKFSLISSHSVPFDFNGAEYKALIQLEEYSKDWSPLFNEEIKRLSLRDYGSVIRLSDIGVITGDREWYTYIDGKMYISESLLKEVSRVAEKGDSKEGDSKDSEVVEEETTVSPKNNDHNFEYWWDIAAPLALIVGVVAFIICVIL